eukprot:164585_1
MSHDTKVLKFQYDTVDDSHWICSICNFENSTKITNDNECIFCLNKWKCGKCDLFNSIKNTHCNLCKNKRQSDKKYDNYGTYLYTRPLGLNYYTAVSDGRYKTSDDDDNLDNNIQPILLEKNVCSYQNYAKLFNFNNKDLDSNSFSNNKDSDSMGDDARNDLKTLEIEINEIIINGYYKHSNAFYPFLPQQIQKIIIQYLICNVSLHKHN